MIPYLGNEAGIEVYPEHNRRVRDDSRIISLSFRAAARNLSRREWFWRTLTEALPIFVSWLTNIVPISRIGCFLFITIVLMLCEQDQGGVREELRRVLWR